MTRRHQSTTFVHFVPTEVVSVYHTGSIADTALLEGWEGYVLTSP